MNSWIKVSDRLPDATPNTDGIACAVVSDSGNVYRAKYMHDLEVDVDSKYWSEFYISMNGREEESCEINEKITHWMPLPESPNSNE